MFTGIVEELGTVRAIDGSTYEIAAGRVLDDIEVGASIAVNGCCLTVTAHGRDWWRTELSGETLARTSLGDLAPGDAVNLERPVAVGGRLGGHVVLGHVDGVGEVIETPPRLRVRLPHDLMRYVVEKGSIAIDGISLTAFGLDGDTIKAAIIPHTCEVTTLGRCAVGGRVNVEVDILAKHVEQLLLRSSTAQAEAGHSLADARSLASERPFTDG